LRFCQVRLAAPQFFVDSCQLAGSLSDSSLKRLCNTLLVACASSLLQSNCGLVGRDTQEETFDVGREISSPRASNQHANFVLKAQGERRDRDLTLSGRIWNHETRSGLVAAQPAAERSTDLLRLSRGMLTLSQPDHLDWRTVNRVVQTGAREIEAQDGEERVEQRAEHLA